MRKIVFINQVTGYLMKDVINVFCKEFDDVALITGSISGIGNPLKTKVEIVKIRSYNKKSPILRLFSWFLGLIQTIFLVNLKYRNYHLFITSNPPLLAFLPLFCRNKYSILTYDVYPDGLVAGGFITENSWLNSIWKIRNKKFYKKAYNIFTLTETMAMTISQYIGKNHIQVIAPWSVFSADFNIIQRHNNLFLKKFNLEDFFIVMYSGNIGLGHNIESLIEVARLLRDENKIRFIIIGEGWNKQLIEKRIFEVGLTNCLLLPFQSSSMFEHSLSSAHIGVVSVSSKGAKVCAPSKTYNLINLRIPLLCISDPVTELTKLINDNEIGRSFKPDQYNEMADFIISMKDNSYLYENYKIRLNECSGNFTIQNASKYLSNFNIN